MNKYERQCLLQAYGWRADTTFDLLHAGENETYVVDTVHMKYALRRYRPGRYTGEQVRSEVAWVDMLHTFMHVPRIVRNKAGDAVSCCHTSTENILYVVSEFVSGETILHPTASHYRTLGHIMRCLHDSADLISTQVSSNWAGWNRPQYDLQYIVEAPLYSLLDFDILTDEDKRRCMNIAAQLKKKPTLAQRCVYSTWREKYRNVWILKHCGTNRKRALDDTWAGWNLKSVYQVSSRAHV